MSVVMRQFVVSIFLVVFFEFFFCCCWVVFLFVCLFFLLFLKNNYFANLLLASNNWLWFKSVYLCGVSKCSIVMTTCPLLAGVVAAVHM